MRNFVKFLRYSLLLTLIACSKSKTPAPPTEDVPHAPYVASIKPAIGKAGSVVTITGQGFSTTVSEDVVTFNGEPAIVLTATKTQLTVTVPATGSSGVVAVSVKNMETLGPTYVYSDTPEINYILPKEAAGGEVLSIYCSKFSTTLTDNVVTINGVVAKVVNISQYYIDVIVPIGAGDGIVTLSVKGLKVSGPQFSYNYVGSVTTLSATYKEASGICADNLGNVYVTDKGNNLVFKITPSGVSSIFAGSTQGSADGKGTIAQFNHPAGICIDADNNLYVADGGNNIIRKITPEGIVSTLAGAAGVAGSVNGTGNAASFNNPVGIAIDNSHNLFVADQGSNKIRKITPTGLVTTYSGSTQGLLYTSPGTTQFNHPQAVCVDGQGVVYIADNGNNMIAQIAPTDGYCTLFTGGQAGYSDGIGASGRFNFPTGMVPDNRGNIYIADSNNYLIRKVTTDYARVYTFAGSTQGSENGIGKLAQFNHPLGICMDPKSNILYVADGVAVRKIVLQ